MDKPNQAGIIAVDLKVSHAVVTAKPTNRPVIGPPDPINPDKFVEAYQKTGLSSSSTA